MTESVNIHHNSSLEAAVKKLLSGKYILWPKTFWTGLERIRAKSTRKDVRLLKYFKTNESGKEDICHISVAETRDLSNLEFAANIRQPSFESLMNSSECKFVEDAESNDFSFVQNKFEADLLSKSQSSNETSISGHFHEIGKGGINFIFTSTPKKNRTCYFVDVGSKIKFFEELAATNADVKVPVKHQSVEDITNGIKVDDTGCRLETKKVATLEPEPQVVELRENQKLAVDTSGVEILETKPKRTDLNRPQPPVIVKAVLKQTIIDELAKLQGITMPSSDETRYIPKQSNKEENADISSKIHSNIFEDVDSTFQLFQGYIKKMELSGSFRARQKKDDIFVANLYKFHSKVFKTIRRLPKARPSITSGIFKMDTELHIHQVPQTESMEHSETSSFKKYSYSDTSSFDSSDVSALLDTSEAPPVDVVDNAELKMIFDQSRIMQQATNAVKMCMENGLASTKEYFEAERILLIASLKRALLMQKLREKRYGAPQMQTCDETDRLIIAGIEFPLMPYQDLQNQKIWFVVTCSCRSALQTSKLIPMNLHNRYLNLREPFVFENVHVDSVINLRVYQARICNNRSNRHRVEKLCCIQPTETHRRKPYRIYYKDLYCEEAVQSEVLPSVFTLCGTLETTIDRLLSKQTFAFDSASKDCALFGISNLTSTLST